MFSAHELELLTSLHHRQVIDLDHLLLEVMQDNTRVTIATDVLGSLRSAAMYANLLGDGMSPRNLRTTLDGIMPLSRRQASIETTYDALPNEGISIYRMNCSQTVEGHSSRITVHLTWTPDFEEQNALRVACETADGSSAWKYTGPWTIGEIARLLLR